MLENKPPALEEAYRKIRHLEIEKEALKKEIENESAKNKNRKNRIKEIDGEIGNWQEKAKGLELKWQNEKGSSGNSFH